MTGNPSGSPADGAPRSAPARASRLPFARLFGLLAARLSGLHLQLLGLIIVPFGAALLALAVLGVRVHQDAMRQLIAERDVRGTRAAAAAIGQNLYHLQSTLRAAARQYQAAATGGAPSVSRGMLDDFDLGYLVLDRAGEPLVSSSPPPLWQHQLRLDEQPPPGALESLRLTEGGDTVVLLIAAETDVVALGGFSIQSVVRPALLSSMVTSQPSSAFIVDEAGALLHYVGERPTGPDLLLHPGVPEGLRGESGSTFREAEGEERAVAFAAIPNAGWALVFEEPWREVTSPVLDLSLLAPLALAPVLAITLLGLWFGARQVIRPLRELEEQATAAVLSPGTFDRSTTGGIAEIRQLRRSLAQMAARIATAQTARQRYVGAITSAQEEERSRLARELHDETIQGLIAIDHRIQMLTMELTDGDGALAEPLRQLHAEVNRSVTELRRMSKALRPVYLEDLGLVPAIGTLVEEFDRDSPIEFTVRTEGNCRRLEPQAELAVYRIVQEALSNVARHSAAESAQVVIECAADRFQVTIQDDGAGFDAPPSSAGFATEGHFGLMGMRERAELIGADLEIRSVRNQGTRVRLRLRPGGQLPSSDRQIA